MRAIRSTQRRRLVALLVATGVVLVGLVWLAVGIDGTAPAIVAEDARRQPTAATAALPAAELATIAAARADARARLPARTVVLPPDPPPAGVPAWSPRLANQAPYRVPVPRGVR